MNNIACSFSGCLSLEVLIQRILLPLDKTSFQFQHSSFERDSTLWSMDILHNEWGNVEINIKVYQATALFPYKRGWWPNGPCHAASTCVTQSNINITLQLHVSAVQVLWIISRIDWRSLFYYVCLSIKDIMNLISLPGPGARNKQWIMSQYLHFSMLFC